MVSKQMIYSRAKINIFGIFAHHINCTIFPILTYYDVVKILIHATKPEDGQATCCPCTELSKNAFGKKSHT